MKRLGLFKVSGNIHREFYSGGYLNLFHKLIIIGAEKNYMVDEITYCAQSELFDLISEGQIIPEYEAIFTSESIYPTWRLKNVL